MKLLLTSVGWSKNAQIGREFLKLVDKKPSDIRIFLVVTPIKASTKKYIIDFERQLKKFKIPKRNLSIFQLDRKIKKDELKDINVIYIFGGNAFDYLNRIRWTGLKKIINPFLEKGGVYVGLSAGSYVACPTIDAASWKHADRNFLRLKDLRGLNLVPYIITAHFTEELRPIIEKSAKKVKCGVVALTDKQAILVDGKKTKFLGLGKKNFFNGVEKYMTSNNK